MTIDEAIAHCEEVVEELEEEAVKGCCDDSEIMDKCIECAKEHRQLAEWLKELEAYREADKEMRGFTQAWEEGAGIYRCIETINKYVDKVVTIKDLEWRE